MQGSYRVFLFTGITASALFAVWYFWWIPWFDDFLGDDDFEGHRITGSPSSTALQSTFNGFLTIANLDRDLVEDLLPDDFELAENLSFWYEDEHPVLLLFGDQTDGAMLAGGTVTPAPPVNRGHYSEMILAVPYVQRSEQTGWHTYIVRMYLDNMQAVLAGAVYGYAKQLACLNWRGALVRVWQQPVACPGPNPLSNKRRLKGDFRITGPWHDGPSAPAQIDNLDDMVGMMTTRILGIDSSDDPVCSFFEWNLDDAEIAEAETTHKFENRFRSDMDQWPGLGEIPSVDDGAVALLGVRWRLADPVSCGIP